MQLVLLAAVIEPRLDLRLEQHRPPNADETANQRMRRVRPRVRDRHEVLDLADSLGAEETSDQDVRVREVQLLAGPTRARWRDLPAAPVPPIEDGTEDARRIEVRTAVPVDRALHPHKCRRMQVT